MRLCFGKFTSVPLRSGMFEHTLDYVELGMKYVRSGSFLFLVWTISDWWINVYGCFWVRTFLLNMS